MADQDRPKQAATHRGIDDVPAVPGPEVPRQRDAESALNRETDPRDRTPRPGTHAADPAMPADDLSRDTKI
jgi:hypothetical protein